MQIVAELTDRQLLERFASRHEAAAFEALVRRHGPMVLRVCRRVLYHGHDAEDAFQATFIVLMRKAGSIARLDSVASWLYRVASRIALRARVREAARHGHERYVGAAGLLQEPETQSRGDHVDLRPVLDEELNQLPEKYRAPIVLCYLEGKTNDEAARQLGCSRGTVAGKLSRGRDLLRDRLARRGLALSAGALAGLLATEAATAAVPSFLLGATVQGVTPAAAGQAVAGGTLSAQATALADASLKSMGVLKVKIAAAALIAAVVAAGAVLLGSAGNDGPPLQLRATLEGHNDGVFAVAFFPDGQTLATGGGDRIIRLWNVGTGKETATLAGHRHKIMALAVSADGLLASGEGDLDGPAGEVKLWDPVRRRELATLPAHAQGVPSLAFSPDGKLLATASWSGTVQLWNVATRTRRAVFDAHQSGVARLCFAPDGTLLASASNDQTVKLWDVARGQERATLRGHTDVVHSLAFSPDGRTVVSGSADGTVRLWDAQTHELRLVVATGFPVSCVAFAPGGQSILSGQTEKHDGEDVGMLKFWNARTGQAVASLPAHKLHVGSAVFSPDGKLLATTSWDRTAKLWDVNLSSKAWSVGR